MRQTCFHGIVEIFLEAKARMFNHGSANPLWGLLFSGPSKELEEAGSIRKQQQRNMKQQETKQPLNVELALASGSDNAGVRVSSASTHFYCTRFVLPASASISQFRLALKEWHFVVGAHIKDACRRCRLPLCLSWWAVLVGCLGGRLRAEVLRAMFMSACGRLWALLRGACGRMWATRTEVLQCLRALVGSTVASVGVPLGGCF